MMSLHRTRIYIFRSVDSRSVQQRLQHAVADFCDTCGIPMPREEMLLTARTEQGKPYFPKAPQLHFSVSHSGEFWSCAIADQTVGYDLQKREQPRKETPEEMLARQQKLARRFFHPTEAEFVSLDCGNHFLTVWTAREAYVKHTGQGIDRHFSEHCVIPDHQEAWKGISGPSESVGWSAMGKYFWKTYYGSDYTLCVCTEMPCHCTVTVCH